MKKFDRDSYINSNSPIRKFLLKFFPKNSEILIMDIGGCEGEESLRYSILFPNSSIFIFEPLPANQVLIEENIKKFNRVGSIKLIDKAVSDKDGFEQFYVSSGQPNTAKKLNWDFGNKSSSLLRPQVSNNPDC